MENKLRCVVCGSSLTGKQIKYCTKPCKKKFEKARSRGRSGGKALSVEDALDFFYYQWSGKKPSFANIQHECSKCKQKFLQDKFYKYSNGSLYGKCKKCHRIQFPLKSPEERKAYYRRNKAKFLKGGKYFDSDYKRLYYQKNKEIIKKRVREYNKKNKKIVNKLKREYRKRRMKRDPQYRARTNLRKALRMAIKKLGGKKCYKFSKLLGCSYEQFSSHIESQFNEGMTWDNYGEWHIDHIRPMASFNLLEGGEQLKCCHYTNLQPLWAKDNIAKGDSWG